MAYSGNPTVRNFRNEMSKISNFLRGSLEDAYVRQADELMANMRANTPEDTGALKRSIRKRVVRGRNRVSVLVAAGGPSTTVRSSRGVAYDYALSVEFGDVDQKAQPFFYSAARLYKAGFARLTEETVDKAIAENNKVRELKSQNYSNEGLTSTRGGRGGAVVVRGRI